MTTNGLFLIFFALFAYLRVLRDSVMLDEEGDTHATLNINILYAKNYYVMMR